MILLTADLVLAIHDEVLNPGELRGLAGDKSLDGALARVDNRLAYGMVVDPFDLAAAYAEAIAQGHCFNDGNKRTAFRAMHMALWLNGFALEFDTVTVGDKIILLAQRKLAAGDLAEWLRAIPR
jgi:death-on-curing protein